jgi:TRAP-type C4-dicarboxylate transport system permease small subunit
LSRLYHGLLDFLGALCGLLILSLMVGVSLDVAVRSITGRPIMWMFEVTEYVLLYIPCLGMAWLAREYGHVAITSFVSKLPSAPRKLVATSSMLFCASVSAVVAYWGVWATQVSIGRGAIAGMMLRMPEYILLWVIPFGFGLAALEFLRLAATDPSGPDEAGPH